ncbi:Tyrosine-protein kinase FRK [Bagarius yarrelli]|uniref:non-specific protein-tyrosine kinase n=1 Tax=Bagarius yarrelli TaxID=175774 RepID=A0A556VWV6_BAGYA|nr:Tyrosine-protein kinase FRK [Bagarius yarrelli]
MSVQPKELWDRMVACCLRTCPCYLEKPTRAGDSRDEPISWVPRALNTVPTVPPPRVYTALWDYTARTAEDLSFRSGDQLELVDQSNPDWWIARALTGISTGRKGYIPANYVAAIESLHAESCPKRVYDIMMECWKDTPADRPTFETLQWKLEEFYDTDISAYDDACRY